MTDTIAAMIVEVNAAGYFFNNLFQLQDGKWRCNLRSELMVPSHTEYGSGPDPVTAVAQALRKLQADKPQRRLDAAELIELDIPAFLRRYMAKAEDEDLVGGPMIAVDPEALPHVAYADEELIGSLDAKGNVADDLVG